MKESKFYSVLKRQQLRWLIIQPNIDPVWYSIEGSQILSYSCTYDRIIIISLHQGYNNIHQFPKHFTAFCDNFMFNKGFHFYLLSVVSCASQSFNHQHLHTTPETTRQLHSQLTLCQGFLATFPTVSQEPQSARFSRVFTCPPIV